MKTVDLHIQQFTQTARVNPMDLHYTERHDQVLDMLFCSLEAKFATEKQDDYVVLVPAAWWDMFKAAHFPKWALRRWPAKTKEQKIPITLIYTTLKTRLPHDAIGPRICIAVNDEACFSRWSDTPLTSRDMFDNVATSRHLWSNTDNCPVCGRSMAAR